MLESSKPGPHKPNNCHNSNYNNSFSNNSNNYVINNNSKNTAMSRYNQCFTHVFNINYLLSCGTFVEFTNENIIKYNEKNL